MSVQSKNATLFERLMEIHSNPPILWFLWEFLSLALCIKYTCRCCYLFICKWNGVFKCTVNPGDFGHPKEKAYFIL